MLAALMGADPTTEGQLATLEARWAQLSASELGIKTQLNNLPAAYGIVDRAQRNSQVTVLNATLGAIMSELAQVEHAIEQVKRTIALQNASSSAQVAVADAEKAQTTVRENAEAFISQGTTKGAMIAGVVAVLGFLGWKALK
ncbi:MAG: hypothetical protein WC906_04145 [Parcubacteria group bacterium]|jgi:hypothetical protein